MTTSRKSELSALPELRLDLAVGDVHIVYPSTDGYTEIALELATALESLTGTRPVIVLESETIPSSGPLIILGNVMESMTVRRLYYESYDFTDLAFPGSGGFTLRTIRDPLGTGSHVILVGGSDIEGVKDAAQQLISRVTKHGPLLKYFNDVQLGKWITPDELDVARYLEDTDEVWNRIGFSGSWDFMEHIAGCGMGYLRTANERYLELFRRELHYFKSHDVYAPNPEAPLQIHGRIYILLIVWDLVRDHPTFSAEDHREFDEMFLYLERSGEGVAQISDRAKTHAVRFNHDTRAALDTFYLGRYFDRRHHLPEAKEWLQTASDLFAPQLTSAKPCEDSWGHQWNASMHNTLCYAMATGNLDYLKSDALKQSADRARMAHGIDGPRVYLANCALVTGDTSYLSLEEDGEAFIRCAAQMRLSKPAGSSIAASFEEVLRSFAITTTIKRRDEMLGLTKAPLDSLWYRTIDSPIYVFNPEDIFKVNLDEADGFDKLALREGWGADDFYLLVDGISGGLHSYQDANCLVWMRECGVEWFVTVKDRQRAQTARAQNGVNVVLNGLGAGSLHRYARLLYCEEQGDFSVIATSLDGVGKTTWERVILRKRGAWTLVVDRVIAHEAGELLTERFWYPAGDHEGGESGFTSRASRDDSQITLRIESTVAQDGLGQFDGGLVERTRVNVAVGQEISLGGLLWVDQEAARALKLQTTEDGFSITDEIGVSTGVVLQQSANVGSGLVVRCGDSEWVLGTTGNSVSASPVPKLPLGLKLGSIGVDLREINRIESEITAVASSSLGSAIGTDDGVIVCQDSDAKEQWRGQVSGAILSLEICDLGIVVGEETGSVSLFDPAGEKLWTVDIPWVSLPWSNWSERRSRVREIACVDINGDGYEEILISNADRRVYAFDREGNQLWKRAIQWGVFTAMWPGVHEGCQVLLGGTSRPSIHGYVVVLNYDGTVKSHLQRTDLVCWSLPANLRDLQQVDIDGDGNLETITAVDTNCRQLIAYRADGSVMWDCDVGACAAALVFDAASKRVYATSEAGYVVAVEGGSGTRAWGIWIGETAELVWVLPGGRVLAIAQRGVIWLISPDGEIKGRVDLGEPITAIPRPGNHRGSERSLILGTASGRVLMEPRNLTGD